MDKGKSVDKPADTELPAELDFFKYAQGVAGAEKRKSLDHVDSQSKKKAKIEEVIDHSDEEQMATTVPRQRITTKGNHVPAPVESFDDLRTRYNVSSRLLSNVSQCGYREPTGIQSYGMPILLEASQNRWYSLDRDLPTHSHAISQQFLPLVRERRFHISFQLCHSWAPLQVRITLLGRESVLSFSLQRAS